MQPPVQSKDSEPRTVTDGGVLGGPILTILTSIWTDSQWWRLEELELTAGAPALGALGAGTPPSRYRFSRSWGWRPSPGGPAGARCGCGTLRNATPARSARCARPPRQGSGAVARWVPGNEASRASVACSTPPCANGLTVKAETCRCWFARPTWLAGQRSAGQQRGCGQAPQRQDSRQAPCALNP